MLNCVCIDVDYPLENVRVSIRRAKKSYKCGECGEVIRVDDKYEYVWAVDDGKPFQAKTCLLCVEIRKVMLPCGFYYGEVWKGIHESNCLADGEEEDGFCICPSGKG